MKYPIGMQNFKNLRTRGFLYVDKTSYIYDLAHNRPCCFLSRPRRFGKSLLLSTMEAYFRGEKELFQGLAISQLEKDWIKYPVLHLDLNNGNFSSAHKLEEFISNELYKWEKEYDVEVTTTELGIRFENVIEGAYKKTSQQVIILIDEYDKPMLQVITKDEEQKKYRELLKPFYGTLKKAEDYIKFIFITGVTKFGKLSVFSDLNQLKDISLMPEYRSICGITDDEFHEYLMPALKDFAKAQGLAVDETLRELRRRYDGYHFSRDVESGVYNPYSLLNAFDEEYFGNYWFQSGTPSFLVDLLKENSYNLSRLDNVIVTEKLLSTIESIKSSPITAIYQSGYLTIKAYEPINNFYTLGFPNEEVKKGFLEYLLPYYSGIDEQDTPIEIYKFVQEIREGRIEAFLNRLRALLATCNYELILDCEAHYQNVLYIIFSLIGISVEVEKHTSNGRIDMVAKTTDYIYIIEFKYDKSAQAAIDQINDKEYALPYLNDNRTIYKVGINFDPTIRNISSDWIIQKLNCQSI